MVINYRYFKQKRMKDLAPLRYYARNFRYRFDTMSMHTVITTAIVTLDAIGFIYRLTDKQVTH